MARDNGCLCGNIKGISEESGRVRRLNRIQGWEVFPSYYFALFMSYKCTKRCPSCYSFSHPHAAEEMDDKMFEDMLEFMVKVYEQTNETLYHILFLGGEPLLRTDRIKRVMSYTKQKTPGMLGGLFTNGDMIDCIDWSDLKGCSLWYLNPTYIPIQEIERRMEVIQSNMHPYNQSIIMHLDDFNMQGTRAEDIARFCVKNKYRFRVSRDTTKTKDDDYKKRLVIKMNSILDALVECDAEGHYVNSAFLIDTIIPYEWGEEGLRDRFTPYLCGKRVISIHPDGTVYPCIRNFNYPVGSIYTVNPADVGKCEEMRFTYRRDDIHEDCKVCDVREICQGGCPNDRYSATGSFGGKSPFCQMMKETIPRVEKLYVSNRDKYHNRMV